MYYLLIEKFNAYRNRTYKSFDTVQEYVDYATANSLNYSLNTTKKTNFNKNDNITASHIFNDDLDPNYLIWINETSGDIESRWFVIHYTHTSGTQFLASLRHDLIADNYPNIVSSPMFIEKGWVDNSDPAVFNNENMGFNQIKTAEYTLRDLTNIAWLVGYIATDHADLPSTSLTYKPKVDLTVNGNFSDWSYASWCDGQEKSRLDTSSPNRYAFCIEDYFTITSYGYVFVYGDDYNSAVRVRGLANRWYCSEPNQASALKDIDWASNISIANTITNIELDNPTWCKQSVYEDLLKLVGKKIQFDDGIYELTIQTKTEKQNRIYANNSGNLYTYLFNNVNGQLYSNFGTSITSYVNYPVYYDIYLTKFTITATKTVDVQGVYTYAIPQTTKRLNDAPYKMFAIPYSTLECTYSFNGINPSKDLSMLWSIDIAKNLGSSLYDLQILPYLPNTSLNAVQTVQLSGNKVVSIAYNLNDTLTEGTDIVYLKDNNNSNVNFMLFSDTATFKPSVTIYNDMPLSTAIRVSDFKISNECDLYRICSPNYASSFEISPAKNGGKLFNFNCYCTYKPFNPFIYIAPDYASLYGQDFRDNRGLVLSGDFSLPIITDAWVNYQLQNKNYLLSFDREIQSIELNNSIQKVNDIAGAITGTIKGGVAGATTGAIVGGGVGAVAGAVIGTVASGVGGAIDLNNKEKLRQDAMDFKKDQFGYQLGNIKALPNTLNKVSSLVATSKIFPFVEYYTCSDVEKNALRNKLKYNGMTIMRIGTISEFLNPTDQTFIKGRLIRNETIACDSDELTEINNELEMGVYI